MENKTNLFSATITIQYDQDMSLMNFQENFKHSPLVGQSNNGCCNTIQYIKSGCRELIEDNRKLFEIPKSITKPTLVKYLGYTQEDYTDWTKEQLREEILMDTDFVDLDEDTELDLIKKYTLYETRGYSQGDMAYVIVLKEDDFEGIETYIDNIFWDMPIWGRIEIFHPYNNDIEIELYEIENIPSYLNYPEDIDFINKEIIKFCKNYFKHIPAKENILKAIKEALPTEIKYPCRCSC